MHRLLACTCLTPILAALPVAALHAETKIDTARTTAVRTATANNGAADSILVDTAGSVKPATGAAVTMDSNNDVTNKGTLQVTGADGAAGVVAAAGTTGAITNSGTITIDESYDPKDTDNDGDVDGAFAQGTGRSGIRTAGAHTGAIANSGTITIEGNNSGGIVLDGPLTGSLAHSGTISVTGDNSVGIRTGDVTGTVTITGSTSVRGANGVGAAILGDVGGALKVQGSIVSTGYRSTTAPSDTTKLDADDLLQGGPALRVAGNVAGGIILDAPPANTDANSDDDDKDGVKDADEGTASVTSYGSAAAIEIGSATEALVIGPVAGNSQGMGLVINGSVSGTGVYKNIDANGLVIGGLGGAVTLSGGMAVAGTVQATSVDRNATAVRIGAGASVPTVAVSGTLAASGGGVAGTTVTALQIDTGGSVTTLTNSGTIRAGASGDTAVATAVLDRSGTLATITNQGSISATSGGAADTRVALDLSANGTGVTLTQSKASATAAAPSISGMIKLGQGNDSIAASAGTIAGDIGFGGGNDQLALSGEAGYTGTASFGTGTGSLRLADKAMFSGSADFGGGAGTLVLDGTSAFSGSLANSSQIAVSVNGGTLGLTNGGAVQLATLTVGSTGAIAVNIDGAAGTNTVYQVAGAAQFASGSQVRVNFANVRESEGQYVFVRAGALSGAPVLAEQAVALPFMYNGAVTTDAAAGTATIAIVRKTTAQLGLNASGAAAYDAIYKALDGDSGVARRFLSIDNAAEFQQSVGKMLPDHAGGVFEAATSGSRTAARILADPNAPLVTRGSWGFWLSQVAWGSSKSIGDTASYDITGWGASGGVEAITGAGNFGVSLGYFQGDDANGDNDNSVSVSQFELGGYWRLKRGPLNAFARVSVARAGFDSLRLFDAGDGQKRKAKGDWNGWLYSAYAGVSYEARFNRFTLRPMGAIDYYRLNEGGYAEQDGGDAFNLTVDDRNSDELTASGSLVAGYDLGNIDPANGWFRIELEGGRRQILSGNLGATTARFKDGDDFTLTAEDRTSGWLGRLRLGGGAEGFSINGEVGVEEQQSHMALSARVSLSVAL
jgi:hypothetical protein